MTHSATSRAGAAAMLSAVLATALLAGCSTETDAMSEPNAARQQQRDQPQPATAPHAEGDVEKATFAAGCFWGVETTFRNVPGVVATQVGYTGGHTKEPTYKQVCAGRTGHAEAVEVTYDPNQLSYDRLLEVFWNCHDPTTPNRQGPDVGEQYRSAVFYHDEDQRLRAEASKADAQKKFDRPIVTEITPASTFWRAEEYHQQYLEKNGRAACPSHLK